MTGLLKALVGDRTAATSAEFALVIGGFIVLVFGTINTGLAMSAVNQIHYAAERSARCLAVHATGDCQDDVEAYAKDWYRGPGVTGLTFVPSDEDCGKQVVGSAEYEILTGFSSTAISISARACYPLI